MIAVIVINYKNEERSLRFIQEEVPKIASPHFTVVVDNGVTAQCRLQNMVAEARIPDCFVVSSIENLGFAKGNNLGAQFAKDKFNPEYLLFANNDIKFLNDNVIDKLIEKLDTLPDVGVIGPKVIGLDGKLQSPEPFIPFWDKHIWVYWSNLFYSKTHKVRRFKQDYSEKAKEGYHYRVMGSIFLTRSKDYFDCGMMDPETFLYSEEAILSERMKKIGKKVYYYPEVAVLHEHGNTTKRLFDKIKVRQLKLESDSYYYRKYIGTPNWQIRLAKITYWLKGLIGR